MTLRHTLTAYEDLHVNELWKRMLELVQFPLKPPDGTILYLQ